MKFNNDKFSFGKDFIYKDNRIKLTEQGKSKVKRLRKITGSRLGALMGADEFMSPFQLWCNIMNMYEMEQNTFFLDAGKIIEPKLKKHVESKTGKKGKSYDPKKIQFDLFQDNQIFGGIPDGEEFDENNQIISILEIKTAQLDKYKWKFKNNQFVLDLMENKPFVKTPGGGLVKGFKNGEVIIPKIYQYQLSLYLYLRNIKTGYFCIAFMKSSDYDQPKNVKFISEFNNYKNYDISSGKKQVLSHKDHILIFQPFHLDIAEFKECISFAENGYKNHVLDGVSPELTSKDLTGFRYGYPEIK